MRKLIVVLILSLFVTDSLARGGGGGRSGGGKSSSRGFSGGSGGGGIGSYSMSDYDSAPRTPAKIQVYKCKIPQKGVVFQNSPCANSTEEKVIEMNQF